MVATVPGSPVIALPAMSHRIMPPTMNVNAGLSSPYSRRASPMVMVAVGCAASLKGFPHTGPPPPQPPATVHVYRLGRVPDPAGPQRSPPIPVETQHSPAFAAQRDPPA